MIPEGYGAGIVMLWDRGTWTPETTDVDAALRKGDLKFTLDGFKLKGSWVLVRTGGQRGRYGSGDQRSWLLIKHRDEWSGDLDITEFAPRSVKSDGDFEDILGADTPEVWLSHRPAKGGDAGAMLAQIIEKVVRLKKTPGVKPPTPKGVKTASSAARKPSRPKSARQPARAGAPAKASRRKK